jgi:hypothetical protein
MNTMNENIQKALQKLESTSLEIKANKVRIEKQLSSEFPDVPTISRAERIKLKEIKARTHNHWLLQVELTKVIMALSVMQIICYYISKDNTEFVLFNIIGIVALGKIWMIK